MRKINSDGIQLIKSFEGKKLKAYKDIVGVWTVGYGHTGNDVTPNMVITEEHAEELLIQDLVRFEESVSKLVKVPITDNMFSALVSFCFNLGAGTLRKSTLLRLLNTKDYNFASLEIVRFCKAGGKVVDGLLRRRKAEQELFLKDINIQEYK